MYFSRKNTLTYTASAFVTLMGAAFVCPSSAQAGFQFDAPAPEAVTAPGIPAPSYPAPYGANAPMPIMPAPQVEPVPLDSISQVPVQLGQEGQTLYARQPSGSLTGAAPSYVAPSRNAANDGHLVINPYPLQGDNALHGDSRAIGAVDHAMAEQSGQLKTLVLPGSESSAAGMISRATSAYPARPPITPPRMAPISYGTQSITPIPGGEGAPLPTLSDNDHAMPAPTVAARPVEQAPLYPQEQISAPSYPSPARVAPSATAQAEVSSYPEAVGFGRDLPLALALSQVVPPAYSFSFADNVNPGETVSWEGGKAWNAVLQDMLAPAGLRAVIAGRQVMIQPAG